MKAGRVLVTGASGFIGRAVVAELERHGWEVRGASRTAPASGRARDWVATGPIDASTDWRAALDGVHAVVHLAARAHVLRETGSHPAASFRRTNVDGSVALARAAAQADVRHFLFMSSIGAVASESATALDEDAAPQPATPYGASKLEAERALAECLDGSRTALAVFRPPLVFGADAPGNVALLASAIRRGVPLPLASIRNRRSFITVDDLATAVRLALAGAIRGTYHVAHPTPESTPGIVRAMARGMGRPARLLPCPPFLIEGAGRALGRQAAVRGLTRSLELDGGRLYRTLGWRPGTALDQTDWGTTTSTGMNPQTRPDRA